MADFPREKTERRKPREDRLPKDWHRDYAERFPVFKRKEEHAVLSVFKIPRGDWQWTVRDSTPGRSLHPAYVGGLGKYFYIASDGSAYRQREGMSKSRADAIKDAEAALYRMRDAERREIEAREDRIRKGLER